MLILSKGNKMKKMFFLCVMSLLLCSISHASDNADIAIEVRADDQFIGVIGKAMYTGKAIEVVTFDKSVGREETISPYAYIYEILDKESKKDGAYFIKCRNQLGVKFTGSLDLTDSLHPKISLISSNGILLVSISEEGREMKKEYLPSMYLGK
jgi:hypothetical protein